MWALELSASLALASSCLFSVGSLLAAQRPDVGRARVALHLTGLLLGGLLGLLAAWSVLREARAFWLLAPMLAAVGLGLGALAAGSRVLAAPRAA